MDVNVGVDGALAKWHERHLGGLCGFIRCCGGDGEGDGGGEEGER